MATSARRAARLLIAGALAVGAAGPATAAPPAVAKILEFRPRQDGVVCSTPEPDKFDQCKVELRKGRTKGSGWLLSDPDGKPLRLFFDSNDDNQIDVWSYYKDGAEVYREVDVDFDRKPDHYRWLNAGGTRWGVDLDHDGKIDTWKMMSPEELSQEVLAALAARDFGRLQALMVNEDDLKDLALPADQAARIRESLKGAQAKFAETVSKLAISGKANWVHLETGTPQCSPADRTGSRYDVIRHPRGTILFEVGGKNEWVQTGEMILVGAAWKLTDAPTPGPGTVPTDGKDRHGTPLDQNPKLAKLVDELTAIDRDFNKAAGSDSNPAAAARHHLRRADLLERIVAEVKPEERDPWIRQVADSLSTAAQGSARGDTAAMTRLVSLERQLAQAMPGSSLAAYVTFREMQADYAAKIGAGDANFTKVQEEWLERLGKFVSAYPKADDTPDAMLQAGMVSEFLSKDVEAKNWYGQLAKAFPDKPQGVKAAGAIRRLGLEGQPLKLAGPTLADPNTTFDADQLAGKIVVVYYWASWNSQSVGDFAKLKLLLDQYGAKGVELVSVNLDTTAEEARAFLRRSPAPGTHLHQPGGLEGKLATDYGVMVLPNLFLRGTDGKVVSTRVQISTLEDEVKKLVK